MKRRRVACCVVALLSACSADIGVEVESRSASNPAPTTSDSTDDTATDQGPTSDPDQSTDPDPNVDQEQDPQRDPEQDPEANQDPTDLPSVVFDLERFDIEVAWTPTTAETPPGGYNGFHTAVQLNDGSFIASGFDAWGDGSQPERAALWSSVDAERWDRRAIDEIAAMPDQQTIVSLVGSDDVTAYGALLDTSSFLVQFDAVGRWTSQDLGASWTGGADRGDSDQLAGSAVTRAMLIDDRIVTIGVANANLAGEFAGQITIESSDGSRTVHYSDTDASGAPVPGADLRDLVVGPEEWLMTGATTRTHGSNGTELYIEAGELDFPSDIGLWSSVDEGATWSFVDIDRFARVGGTQRGQRIRYDGERYWLLSFEQGFGVFGVNLYTSTDARSWSLHRYRRPDFPVANDFTSNADVFVIDGAIVVTDEVYSNQQPQLMMTVIDPDTDEVVSIDLTAELDGLHQVEDIVTVSGGTLGFGRVERGVTSSDLQVIEIRRIDESTAPAEIDVSDA